MKMLYTINWLAFVAAFLAAEFTNLSVTDWHVPALLGAWFLLVELYCAFTRNGYTFSEHVWAWGDMGFHIAGFPVRAIPAWLLASAMTLRTAGTARLYDGDDISQTYVFGHLPLDLFLVGVVLWLFAHFASGGKYGND